MYNAGFNLDCGLAGTTNLLKMHAPPTGSFATALVCGYFAQDSLLMILYPKEMKAGLGGSSAYKIMWMHHLVSLIVWPYGLTHDTGVVFVVYFIATEATNIGANIFALANRGGFFVKQQLAIGILWMISFAVIRVIPVPYILYAYAKTHLSFGPSCGLTTPEFIVSLVTVPIPIGLNLFWFYKIVSKARRMIFPKKKA